MPEFTQITGVGVAALSVYLLWKLASNHISHNTGAIEKLTEAIQELKTFLQNKL